MKKSFMQLWLWLNLKKTLNYPPVSPCIVLNYIFPLSRCFRCCTSFLCPSRSHSLPSPPLLLITALVLVLDQDLQKQVDSNLSRTTGSPSPWPHSSQAYVFASATARAMTCLVSQYPSATSGVPQANHSR
ncbi:hypothetical protein ILYODFUR_007217 [Ilyodon furcidens]|uniref:Uncharacterized protein n=1 Tax=Ilyodon furcidens TaxID=33524 RepID=A0ABV0V108_9TELE